jgi:hypothetical protein
VVTCHHTTVSQERADSVQYLLMGNRFAWAALSERVSKPEDRAHVRAWASEPLPEDDAAWTLDTWGTVFDLYVRELAPLAPSPPGFTKHPRIEVHYGRNFVPHVVARDATGDAERYVEMNGLNPTKPKGPRDRGWEPTYPGETVWLPDDWDPFVENLVAAGWHAFHGERDASPPPEPPHLEHAPRAVGCCDHHLEHPYVKAAERRAEKRHVEVIVPPEDALACNHDGPCNTTTCEVYDPIAFHLEPVTATLPQYRPFAVRTVSRDFAPLTQVAFELQIDARVRRGRTDHDGWIRTHVPYDVMHGDLRIELPEEGTVQYPITFAAHEPAATESGARGRLHCLGYRVGAAPHLDPEGGLAEALADFQKDYAEKFGLLVTGALDQPTAAAIDQVFGVRG